jgi:hypothetical protein
MLNISLVFQKYLYLFYGQQSNNFFFLFCFQKQNHTLKNDWKSSKSYKRKQKYSIKPSNELKNKTLNFSSIHIN